MEGSVETQNMNSLTILHPKIFGILHIYLLPKNMDDNFHKKMGRHKQFPV